MSTPIEKLRNRGVSEERIRQFMDSKVNKLVNSGVDYARAADFINRRFGLTPDDKKSYSKAADNIIKSVTGNTVDIGPYEFAEEATGEVAGTVSDPLNRYIVTDFNIEDALQAGYQISVTGLTKRGRLPDVQMPRITSVVNSLGAGAAQMLGDLPTFIMGSIIGAGTTGNPITAAGGGFALTEGYRQMLIDKYANGEITDFNEFWERLNSATNAAIKAWDVGALTAATGIGTKSLLTKGLNRVGVPGNITNLAVKPAALTSEVAAMTTAGALLDGHVPSAREFVDAASLIGLMKMGNFYRTKFFDLYRSEARKPLKVVTDSRIDISMREDLSSINTRKPRSYGGKTDTNRKLKTKRYDYDKAYAKVEKQISRGGSIKESLKNFKTELGGRTWHQLYTYLVDRFHPFQYRAAIKRGEVTLSTVKMRSYEGRMVAKAEHWLNHGSLKYGEKVLKNIGESLSDILLEVKDNISEFGVYLVTERVNELNRRGIKYTGFDKKASDRVRRELGRKYKNLANRVVAFNHSLIDYMRDSGMLTKESVKAMKELGTTYIPFQKILETGREGIPRKGRVDVRGSLQRIVGSKERIVDPFEAIIKNTYHILSLVERNDTMKTVARQFGKKQKGKSKSAEDIAFFLESVGKTAEKNTLYVWEKGKRHEYKVDSSIVKAIEGMDRETSRFVRLLSLPARGLRAGAILTPEFMVRNPIRDQFMASIYSRYGYVFGYDMLRGWASFLKKDKIYKEWVESGAPNSTFVSWDRNYMQAQLRDLYKLPVRNKITGELELLHVINNINPFRYPRNFKDVASRINPISKLRWLSDFSETGTRLGEFIRAREAGVPMKDRAFASREITQDFRRVGSMIKGLNLITSFLNAQIQGIDRFGRAVKDNPGTTLVNAFMGITVPSLLMGLVRNDIIKSDPKSDMAIALKEIPAWQKDLFWIIPGNDGLIYRFPKPFEVGVLFGSSAERFVDYMFETDPDATNYLEYLEEEGYINNLIESFIPDIMPNIGRPVFEAKENVDSFTGQPLIPAYLEGVLPELQYTSYTSETIKNIAKNINRALDIVGLSDTPYITSPIILQNFVREWTGGLGKYVLDAMDWSLTRSGVILPKPYEDPAKTLADMPAIKAFIVRFPMAGPDSISKFYKNIEKAEQKLNSIRYLARTNIEAGKLEELLEEGQAFQLPQIKGAISTLYGLIRRYNIDPNMSSEEKRQIIDDTYIQLISIARMGNSIINQINKSVTSNSLEVKK